MRRINIAKISDNPNYRFNRLYCLCILRTHAANGGTDATAG